MNLFSLITGFTWIAVLLMSVWLVEAPLVELIVNTGHNVMFKIPQNCSDGYYLMKTNPKPLILATINKKDITSKRPQLSRKDCSKEKGTPTCFTYNVTSDPFFGHYILRHIDTGKECDTRYHIKRPDDETTTNTPTEGNTTSSRSNPTFLSTNALTTYETTTNPPMTVNTTSSRWTPMFLSTNALKPYETTTNTPTTANTTSSRWTPTFLSTNTLQTYETTTNTPTAANTTSSRSNQTFLSTNALATYETTTNPPMTANTTSSRWTPMFLSTNALKTSGTTAVQTRIIEDILKELRSGNTTALEALNVLASRTKTATLVKIDLHQIESALEEIISNLTLEVSELQTVTTDFMEVASNLINTNKAHLWRENMGMDNNGAESVINLVDSMVSRLLNVASNESIKLNFNSSELYVEVVTAVECKEAISFPNRKEVNEESYFAQTISAEGVNTTSYSGVIYYGIGELITLPTDRGNMFNPVDVSNRKKVQPTIISFTTPGFGGRVLITIKVDNQKHKDPLCVFLDKRENMWSDKGCKLVSHDTNSVQCECYHLTNFAVLMSVMDVSVHENTVLNVLSIVSCCISIMCLLVTMVIHIAYKRKLTAINSSKVLLLTVLCGVLIFTYILVLAGITKTDNKVVCTAIAVILHLSLLTVFSLMLAIGIDYMLMVVKPRYTKNLDNPMILASFVCPAVIVGISSVATRLNGYGNDKACWLSMENSAKLAFIIPVCLVVCVNIGILIVMFKAMFDQSTMKKKSRDEKIRTSIRNIFILSPVFGFTWIIGIFAVNKDTIAFQYVFVILNGLQGVLIMVCHCFLNQKVRSIIRSRSYRRKLLLESSNQATKSNSFYPDIRLQSTTAV